MSKPIEVKAGHFIIKVYTSNERRGYRKHTIVWRVCGVPHRESHAKKEVALARARAIVKDLASGQPQLLQQFTQEDRGVYLAALGHLKPTGRDLLMASCEYAEAWKLVAALSPGTAMPVLAAARAFAQWKSARS